MAATCDGLRVRLMRTVTFNRPRSEGGEPGPFAVEAGEICAIVDTEATRAYTTRAKAKGQDLIPVMLSGAIRYLPRADLELVK